MPRTDIDPLGEAFEWRLRAELNRVRPRYSQARYLSPRRPRIGVWRFAPIALAAVALGLLGVTAYAATGSANPVVWTQQIVNTIHPDATPAANPVSTPAQGQDQQDEPQPNAPPAQGVETAQPSEPGDPEGPSDGMESGSSDQGH